MPSSCKGFKANGANLSSTYTSILFLPSPTQGRKKSFFLVEVCNEDVRFKTSSVQYCEMPRSAWDECGAQAVACGADGWNSANKQALTRYLLVHLDINP